MNWERAGRNHPTQEHQPVKPDRAARRAAALEASRRHAAVRRRQPAIVRVALIWGGVAVVWMIIGTFAPWWTTSLGGSWHAGIWPGLMAVGGIVVYHQARMAAGGGTPHKPWVVGGFAAMAACAALAPTIARPPASSGDWKLGIGAYASLGAALLLTIAVGIVLGRRHR